MRKRLLFCFCACFFACLLPAQSFTLSSPDKHITAQINLKDKIYYTVTFDADIIVHQSFLQMSSDMGELGQ